VESDLFSPFGSEPLKMSTPVDGSKSGTPLDFARLFKMLPPTHFFLKTASFDQFTKPSNRFLNGLFVPNH
jgi:hypothetical protein